MTAVAGAQSYGEVIPRTCRRRAVSRLVLLGGIATVAVYGAGNLLSSLLCDGYSFRDRAISDGTIVSHRQLEPLPWKST
jgi:hypothetical protein